MPSGPKKRKAAKKKKEKQVAPAHHDHHHPHSVHSHGDDDLKHHDDKDSDAEDVSSPVSQEHPDNHHQEEPEKIITQGSSEDNKSPVDQKEDNEATREETEERDIEIEQEFEPTDDELNSQNTSLEDFELPRDSNGGVLQQNLDKESAAQNEAVPHATDELSSNHQFAEDVEPRNHGNDGVLLRSLDEKRVAQSETGSKLESDDLNSKTAGVEPQKEAKDEPSIQTTGERSIDLKEPDAKPANVELDDQNAIIDGDHGGVSQIEANLKTVEGTNSKTDEPHIIDKKIVLVDNSQFSKSIEEVNSFSKGLSELKDNSEVGDHHSSSFEQKSVDEVEKLKLCQGKICGDTSASTDGNEETKGNGEKEAILQERDGKMPPNCVNLGPEKRGTEAIVKKHETVAAPDAKTSATYNVSVTENANGSDSSNSPSLVEHLKDSEIPKSSDRQPLIASAPRVVQRTSWMSCCGLLEVFSGSNR